MRRQVRRVQEAKPSAPGSGDEAVQAALEQRLWTSPPTKRQEERRGCEGPNSRWPAPRGDQRALRARLALAPRPPKTDESRGPGVTALMSSSRLRGGYPAADGPASYKAAQSSRRNGRNAGCPPIRAAETARLTSDSADLAGVSGDPPFPTRPRKSPQLPTSPHPSQAYAHTGVRRPLDALATGALELLALVALARLPRPPRRPRPARRPRPLSQHGPADQADEPPLGRGQGPPRPRQVAPRRGSRRRRGVEGRAGRHCPPCRGRSRLCRHPRHVPLALPVHPALGQRARHDAAARRRHERRARCGAAPRRRRERRRRARPRGQLAPSLCGQLGTRPDHQAAHRPRVRHRRAQRRGLLGRRVRLQLWRAQGPRDSHPPARRAGKGRGPCRPP
ncbi:hypothetical protein DMC30DRAFT_376568, partial [Rhodotorula diobovata]